MSSLAAVLSAVTMIAKNYIFIFATSVVRIREWEKSGALITN